MRTFVWLTLIVLLAAGLRIHKLTAQSMWCDEFLSLEGASGRAYAHELIPTDTIVTPPPRLTELAGAEPLTAIWTKQHGELYPPLYLVILRGWRMVFGESVVAARALSLIGSLAGIVLLFDAVRVRHGAAAGLWAAALAAVAGPQIIMAQETRGYTVLFAAGAGACAAISWIEKFGPTRGRAIALAVCSLAMLLLHYFAWGAVAGIALYAVIQMRGAPRRTALLAIGCAMAVTAIAWGPFMPKQIKLATSGIVDGFIADDGDGRLMRSVLRIAQLPVRMFFEPQKSSRLLAAAGVVTYLLVPFLAWRRREMLLWMLFSAGVIVPLILLDAARATIHVEVMRYTLLASVGAFALVAAAFTHRPGRTRYALPAIFFGCAVLFLQDAYPVWKSDWRDIGQVLAANARRGDVIVFAGTPQAGPYSAEMTYVSTIFYAPDATEPIVILSGKPRAALFDELKNSSGVLLVSSDLAPSTPGELFLDAKLKLVGRGPFLARVFRVDFSESR